jgi:hypothetical protein
MSVRLLSRELWFAGKPLGEKIGTEKITRVTEKMTHVTENYTCDRENNTCDRERQV